MSYVIPAAALGAARAHALKAYPEESCGLVVGESYLPCVNYAIDPEADFVIAGHVWTKLAEQGREVACVIHSHPNGPLYPSAADMQGQMQTAVPWAILPTDGERVGDAIIWDCEGEPAPVLTREFRHGVSDCFALGRDVYRLGRDRLLEQDIEGWPLPPVHFPDWPRRDGWWEEVKDDEGNVIEAADNLYLDHFKANGFRIISANEVQPGDAFLVAIRSDKPNHCGVYLGNNLILHHLPGRPSRREPIGIWLRAIHTWLRHEELDRLISDGYN